MYCSLFIFNGIRWNLRFNIFSELSAVCAHAHAGHTQYPQIVIDSFLVYIYISKYWNLWQDKVFHLQILTTSG